MPRYSYDDFIAAEETAAANPRVGGTSTSGVSYFGLKNDGDEAVVRFDYSTKEDIEVMSVHLAEAGGKKRKVLCLRTPREALDVCPLCAAGYQSYQKMYVRLVEYVKQPDGSYKPEPRIWERKGDFAKTIVNLISMNGDLRECLFMIKRQGASGDTNTTYLINFLNPARYPDSIYKRDFSGFNNYSLINKVVYDKSAQDMVTYLDTGNFPAPTPKQTVQEAIPTASSAQADYNTQPAPAVTGPAVPPPSSVPPVYNYGAQPMMRSPADSVPATAPASTPGATPLNRPARRYDYNNN